MTPLPTRTSRTACGGVPVRAQSPRPTSAPSPACRDFNPIHVDAEHAAGTPFGERLTHGALVPPLGAMRSRIAIPDGCQEVVAIGRWWAL
jgi:hypothetical protein